MKWLKKIILFFVKAGYKAPPRQQPVQSWKEKQSEYLRQKYSSGYRITPEMMARPWSGKYNDVF